MLTSLQLAIKGVLINHHYSLEAGDQEGDDDENDKAEVPRRMTTLEQAGMAVQLSAMAGNVPKDATLECVVAIWKLSGKTGEAEGAGEGEGAST